MKIEEEQMDEDLYWDLLEEQHAHDVVISGAMEGGEEDERSD